MSRISLYSMVSPKSLKRAAFNEHKSTFFDNFTEFAEFLLELCITILGAAVVSRIFAHKAYVLRSETFSDIIATNVKHEWNHDIN